MLNQSHFIWGEYSKVINQQNNFKFDLSVMASVSAQAGLLGCFYLLRERQNAEKSNS